MYILHLSTERVRRKVGIATGPGGDQHMSNSRLAGNPVEARIERISKHW